MIGLLKKPSQTKTGNGIVPTAPSLTTTVAAAATAATTTVAGAATTTGTTATPSYLAYDCLHLSKVQVAVLVVPRVVPGAVVSAQAILIV